MKIRIGTRGSKLALAQAEYVKKRLESTYPSHTFELCIIQTKGDKILDKPLNQIGDKGVFVKEIEQQLLDEQIDMAVHSMKDMPSKLPKGLVFSRFWKREDARDVLILREKKRLSDLPKNAVIGTGSARRKLQLLNLRPDFKVVGIRGNVDSRLKKMEEQQLDGIVLAAAGLNRLGMEDKITCYFEPEEMVPAVAQGILALELKAENQELLEMLNGLSDMESDITGQIERAFLKEMGGDCHTPVGAYCSLDKEKKQVCLQVVFGKSDREKLIRTTVCEKLEVAHNDFFCFKQFEQLKEEMVQKAAKEIRSQISSKVYLVGAGPGDETLITLKGKELLEKADCVIYDRLVSPKLLKFVGDCEKIYVGKENHHHTMTQSEINALLIHKSMTCRCVVRLKGGDPYVFGRGGEEALALSKAGVAFEVVPGISSAIAGLTYAGIPITHRNVSGGFHVLTAHNQKDELAELDFSALAKEKNTLVFLMGLSKLPQIVQGFLDAGKEKNTLIAVISNATTAKQRTVVATLEEIVQKVEEEQIYSPALIVVGEVISLQKELNFQESKSLFGKRYLLPKIDSAAGFLAEQLKNQGADVTEWTLGEICYSKMALERKELETMDWLFFTSRHGVEGFFKNLFACGMDVRNLSKTKIAAIGEKTANVLKQYGIVADFVPTKADSDTFCKELKEIFLQENKILNKIAYVRAKEVDNQIEEKFSKFCQLIPYIVYENKTIEMQAEFENFDGIIFTCASLAERTAALSKGNLKNLLNENGKIFSIGVKTTEKIKKLGTTEVETADNATYEDLLKLILGN